MISDNLQFPCYNFCLVLLPVSVFNFKLFQRSKLVLLLLLMVAKPKMCIRARLWSFFREKCAKMREEGVWGAPSPPV